MPNLGIITGAANSNGLAAFDHRGVSYTDAYSSGSKGSQLLEHSSYRHRSTWWTNWR